MSCHIHCSGPVLLIQCTNNVATVKLVKNINFSFELQSVQLSKRVNQF